MNELRQDGTLGRMVAFAFTIFTGAFLLFLVQPLIAKFILPWFGGGPGVWATCLLFFQVSLLAGYGYAHLSVRRLTLRTQIALHLGLTFVALAFLPIIPADTWKPITAVAPEGRILLLLLGCIGLPYLALSATGPLLQHWFTIIYPQRSPYRLYALSNVGSLLALLAFPFGLEPNVSLRTQALGWGWGLGLYALACVAVSLHLWNKPNPARVPVALAIADARPIPSGMDQSLWVLLPACATTLLLAVTNKLCLDVAVVPFLWVVPLSLYLLTFILAFDRAGWYCRFVFTLLISVAGVALIYALFRASDWSLWVQVIVFCGGLFVCCMVCHGELYRLRPAPRWLTRYYLLIAAGGAAGGVFVALLAPFLSRNYFELHWGLFACAILLFATRARDFRVPAQGAGRATDWQDRWLSLLLPLLGIGGLDFGLTRSPELQSFLSKDLVVAVRLMIWMLAVLAIAIWTIRRQGTHPRYFQVTTLAWLAVGTMAIGLALLEHAERSEPDLVQRVRNFYGVLSVFDHRPADPENRYRVLLHGRITHGLQFANPRFASWPTTYYTRSSGVGRAIDSLPETPRRLGLVGLGVGTLAAYGRPGDNFRIYEINPQVVQLAQNRFTYLSNCPARIELVLGDARLSLERELPCQFDLLALDAFSSDSIPVHLLTREAIQLYLRHLKPTGILAVHISNHFLNLEPVVAALSHEARLHSVLIDTEGEDEEWWDYGATWVLLSRDEGTLRPIQEAGIPLHTHSTPGPLWTDDFTSLYHILKSPK